MIIDKSIPNILLNKPSWAISTLSPAFCPEYDEEVSNHKKDEVAEKCHILDARHKVFQPFGKGQSEFHANNNCHDERNE